MLSCFNLTEDILKELWGKFWRALRDYWNDGKSTITIFIISVLTLIYGKIALDHEIEKGWTGHESLENVLTEISVFVPYCSAFVAVIIGSIDILVLLSDAFREKREKPIETSKAEGFAQGGSKGEAEAFEKIAEWYGRKIEAEARGEPFTETPPKIK